MKRLILLRHAKTEPWSESLDDHARALTERGHSDMALIGTALVREGWIPDVALVSTARRAHETWIDLAPYFKMCQRHLLDELYLAGTVGLEDQVSAHAKATTVMLIGHNPGIHDFALSILRAAGSQDHRAALALSAKMPTGAAVLFEAVGDGQFTSETFRLQAFLTPRMLRA